ncbi:unnamed protein product [Prorocentrum cordatum]|uniref:Subtilisin n=1 Tax=Prorocentrum cordatum TaxID=2364126 RepID=A0ABN9WLR8_9DINO|nr:unnamed protein product [Polarella glacialis]
MVAAGQCHTVLLTRDGTAAACGSNRSGQCDIPPLAEGQTYTQVAAGGYHTALLTSIGTVTACGANDSGRCDIPPLAAGQTYTQVDAGACHTVLLTSDGTAVACGTTILASATFRRWPQARFTDLVFCKRCCCRRFSTET